MPNWEHLQRPFVFLLLASLAIIVQSDWSVATLYYHLQTSKIEIYIRKFHASSR